MVKLISTVVYAFFDPTEPTIYMVKTPGAMLFMSVVLRVNVPVVSSKLDYVFSSSIWHKSSLDPTSITHEYVTSD